MAIPAAAALLGLSRSFCAQPDVLDNHIASTNTNTPHRRTQYLDILLSKTWARTSHKAPLSTIILKKANKSKGDVRRRLLCCRGTRNSYRHAPHVCLESSLSLPAGSLLCGLNSRCVAMTGHTIGGGQFDKLERSNLAQTFFKTGMSSESDLVPHITHSIRASNLCPMVKEVLNLNLFIVISCPVITPVWIKTNYLTNNLEGG